MPLLDLAAELAQALRDGRRHVHPHVAGAELGQRLGSPQSQPALVGPEVTAIVDVVDPQRRLRVRQRRQNSVWQHD